MIQAAQEGAERIMQILLEEWNLSPNIFDRDDPDSRTTPLFRAVLGSRRGDETVDHGHPGLVKLLLCYGASPSQACLKDETPLHEASNKCEVEIARLLIEAGADISALNRRRETPLHRASSQSNVEGVKLLLEAGA